MNPVYAGLGTTIFEHMSTLARELNAINLGQGFPDTNGPPEILAAAANALTERSSQYPPMLGLAELRQAVADHYARHQGLDLAASEVVITSGATEALAAALLALISPGDEVILFQPLYDAYVPLVERAGGVPRIVRLEPPHWRIDIQAVRALVTPRTRLLVLNNPLNPAGAMVSETELAGLAQLCVDHDLIAVCDEVWEHVVFDGRRHRSLIAMPDMRARTVKIGSAGKIFSVTGWKVGWMCAAPALSTVLAKAHQFLTFTTPPALQWAVAEGLGWNEIWFDAMRAGYQRSRDRLIAGLRDAGYVVLPGASTWFVCVDLPASGISLSDLDFCEKSVREAGVAAIPISAFYADRPVTHIVRLCFSKDDATLDEATGRLARFRQALVG